MENKIDVWQEIMGQVVIMDKDNKSIWINPDEIDDLIKKLKQMKKEIKALKKLRQLDEKEPDFYPEDNNYLED